VLGWLTRARELRARLRTLGERWPASLADLRSQLDSLFAAGFVAAIPEAQWPRIALYLRAIDVRLERLPNKPARDEDLTRQLAPLAARLPAPFHPARWVLEEWRIALFAQELRAQGGPTATKLEAALREA
jgi:ATP-dependent helicase HrpA